MSRDGMFKAGDDIKARFSTSEILRILRTHSDDVRGLHKSKAGTDLGSEARARTGSKRDQDAKYQAAWSEADPLMPVVRFG